MKRSFGKLLFMLMLLAMLLAITSCQAKPDKTLKRQNAFLVAVGINTFTDPKTRPIQNAEKNASRFYRLMTTKGKIQKQNARLLLGKKATSKNILKVIDHWLSRKVNRRSTIFFYFSSHGTLDDGENFLTPHDDRETSGVSLRKITRLLKKLNARMYVLFLDACHSGYTDLNQKIHQEIGSFDKKGWIVFSSSRKEKVSYDGNFSSLLLKALNGKADYNEDKIVSAAETQVYLEAGTEYWTKKKFGLLQKPFFAIKVAETIVPLTYLDPKAFFPEKQLFKILLYIRVHQKNVTVLINGKKYSKTPFRKLLWSNNYRVIIKKKGYLAFDRVVRVTSNTKHNRLQILEVKLAKKSKKKLKRKIRQLIRGCIKGNKGKCYNLALAYQKQYENCATVFERYPNGATENNKGKTNCHKVYSRVRDNCYARACDLKGPSISCYYAGCFWYKECTSKNQDACKKSISYFKRSSAKEDLWWMLATSYLMTGQKKKAKEVYRKKCFLGFIGNACYEYTKFFKGKKRLKLARYACYRLMLFSEKACYDLCADGSRQACLKTNKDARLRLCQTGNHDAACL